MIELSLTKFKTCFGLSSFLTTQYLHRMGDTVTWSSLFGLINVNNDFVLCVWRSILVSDQ